jgi:hypothetical protein
MFGCNATKEFYNNFDEVCVATQVFDSSEVAALEIIS